MKAISMDEVTRLDALFDNDEEMDFFLEITALDALTDQDNVAKLATMSKEHGIARDVLFQYVCLQLHIIRPDEDIPLRAVARRFGIDFAVLMAYANEKLKARAERERALDESGAYIVSEELVS